jgi:hypothetical protein
MTRIPAFVFLLLLFAAGFACQKPVDNSISTWKEYEEPLISKANLYDTLPGLTKHKLSVKEIKGIKVVYTSGRSTSYFEYETDSKILLEAISALPFKKGNAVNDTLCRRMNNLFSLSGKKVLSQDELVSAKFFWNIEPSDYAYYECLKYPARHTLLINNRTGTILHRVEIEA